MSSCVRSWAAAAMIDVAAEVLSVIIHQQVKGFAIGTAAGAPPVFSSLAQGGMVGNGEIEAEHANGGADHPFGLLQRQVPPSQISIAKLYEGKYVVNDNPDRCHE